MAHEVLRSETIGGQNIRLISKDREFRVVLDSPIGRVSVPALAVRWRFRTAEVARAAFEFAVATQRVWEAWQDGKPADHLLSAVERASSEVNALAARHGDFPPGSAGADALDDAEF